VSSLELLLADLMLLPMMKDTQTDRPTVRWLQPGTTIGAPTHVRALDRSSAATGHTA